jgi:hypothetical protein
VIISSTVKTGYDTWVDSANITKRHGGKDWMRLKTGAKRGLLWMPVPARIAGRTIPTATLKAHAHGTLAAQTITVKPVIKQWDAKTATWKNQPSTTGTAVTKVLATTVADGGEVVIDVTSLIQQIADGLDNFGWLITTSVATDQLLATFDSGLPAWRLDISYVDAPDAPTNMQPNGTVVSEGLPISSFDYTTFGGDDSDLAQIQFQIDKGNNGTVDYTSPWLPITTPQIDLSSASGTVTVAAGDVIAYRYKVQDAGGQPSDYGDWATYTYQPLPTLTVDSPVGGHLYDPTSDILAHISTTHLEAFRVRITDGDDQTNVRYDSKKQPGDDPSNISWALPLRWDDDISGVHGIGSSMGSLVFPHDGTYQCNIRAFDDYEREATPGAPSFVETWFSFDFTDSGTVGTVTTFTATQVGTSPAVDLVWTDGAAPDSYVIERDGAQLAQVDPADVTIGGGTYKLTDTTAAPGSGAHTYKIRRITTGVGRSNPVSDTVTINVQGTWLLRPNGDSVVLDGDGIDQVASTERRLTYQLVNLPYDLDILTGYEGLSGPLTLSVEDDDDQTVADAITVLSAIKRKSTESVRIAYANINKPVRVSNLDWQPDPEDLDLVRQIVRFTVKQVGEFDFRVD